MKASEEFIEAFREGVGGCRAECDCGRQFFEDDPSYSWEDGELEGLRAAASKDPDKCQEMDCVSYLTVGGKTFVIGCLCNGYAKYEQFIIAHQFMIAKYLNARSKVLEEQSKGLKIAGVLSGCSEAELRYEMERAT